jgi:glutamate:GABA antiporter
MVVRPAMPELPSERTAGRLLGRVLTTKDLVVIFAAAVMFVANAAAIQPAGPAAFAWWVLGCVCFFVPSILIIGMLGLAMPGEGSIYLWVRKALGPFWGFVAGFCAWWPVGLVMVSVGTTMLGFAGYVFPESVGSWAVETQGIAIIAFLLATGFLSSLRLRQIQNVVNVLFIGCLAGIALLVIAAAVHMLSGHHAEVDPAQWSAYRPSSTTGVGASNWSFFGLVILGLIGVEVPLNMGAEFKRPASVFRHLLWGGLIVMVGYILVTWAIMVTVPVEATGGSLTAPLPMVVSIVFGHTAATIVAVLFAVWMFIVGTVYNYSFGRLLFVASLDRVLPAGLAKLNHRRMPANAQWTQIWIAVAFSAVIFVLLPVIGIGGSPADIQAKVNALTQASITVVWCVSILILFVTALIIKRRHPEVLARFWLGRRGPLWVCCVAGGFTTLVGVAATLSGSWTPLIPNDSAYFSVFDAKIYWGTWSWWLSAITAVSFASAVVMSLVGRRSARHQRSAFPEPANEIAEHGPNRVDASASPSDLSGSP